MVCIGSRRGASLARVVPLVLFCLALCATAGHGFDYTYEDDFSTDQAMTDSHDHSVFVTSIPDPWPLTGFLIYEHDVPGDRALAFYNGTLHDSDARLVYAMPLESVGQLVSSGSLEFDIVWEISQDMGLVRVWTASLGLIGVGGNEGHYVFDVSPTQPVEQLLIIIKAHYVRIDNLLVNLEYSTPVESSTWSTIKGIFRSETGPA